MAKRCRTKNNKVTFSSITEQLWIKLLAEVKAAEESGDPNPCLALFD